MHMKMSLSKMICKVITTSVWNYHPCTEKLRNAKTNIFIIFGKGNFCEPKAINLDLREIVNRY